MSMTLDNVARNFIDGIECDAGSGQQFVKTSPVNGRELFKVARSNGQDVQAAVSAAKKSQPCWEAKTVVDRANILRAAAMIMLQRKNEIAEIVALETGKSLKDALGETSGAIEMGFFIAGEGRRFYGKTTTSAVPYKSVSIVRQPVGNTALIVAANTPIANVAWKAFPALLCGNSAVLKASEDTPLTALLFARVLKDAGLPDGVFNVVQGYGEEAGIPLVISQDIDLISFTGSCKVGRFIAEKAGARLAKVCLELGGKNPLIVCDDADLDLAVEATVLSAFSNAGQRCASGSRIIVFDRIYDTFKRLLLERTEKLKVGSADTDDYGPVINERQLANMLKSVEGAKDAGAVVLSGGYRLTSEEHRGGCFLSPTILESVNENSSISLTELFGPITCLYRVKDLSEAIALANNSPYGLTGAIHTRNINNAMTFLTRIKVGAAIVNGPTYGSEPHMPFGGLKNSGNGFREAGTEVLDVYSEWKTVSINFKPEE